MQPEQVAIVGGGILGVALARSLAAQVSTRVTLFEKEAQLAAHQTGRNSNVVHAGLYYQPGSEKAVLCRRGRGLLEDFCTSTGVPYVVAGKVVVSLTDHESNLLAAIRDRALANGVADVRMVDRAGLVELAPHVRGIDALYSPSTAITDYGAVTRTLAAEAVAYGAEIVTGAKVTEVSTARDGAVVTVNGHRRTFDLVVLCAGLHSDRLAREALPAEPHVVPFRGEYYALTRTSRDLVRRLIYPVPDPRYPFLGVHLTPQVDGSVLVGPNAVLALAREGYRWRDVRLRDVGDTLAWPGFPRFARKHWRTGVSEMYRSLSKSAFLHAAQRYVPELRRHDLTRVRSGVRAQAMNRDGSLVDDFVIQHTGRVVAVRNAPSPAATSALAIAERLVEAVQRHR